MTKISKKAIVSATASVKGALSFSLATQGLADAVALANKVDAWIVSLSDDDGSDYLTQSGGYDAGHYTYVLPAISAAYDDLLAALADAKAAGLVK